MTPAEIQTVGDVPKCERCDHVCNHDDERGFCSRCGGDPMVSGDTLCIECDRAECAEYDAALEALMTSSGDEGAA